MLACSKQAANWAKPNGGATTSPIISQGFLGGSTRSTCTRRYLSLAGETTQTVASPMDHSPGVTCAIYLLWPAGGERQGVQRVNLIRDVQGTPRIAPYTHFIREAFD